MVMPRGAASDVWMAKTAEEAGQRETRGVLQGVVLRDDEVFEHGHLREQADAARRLEIGRNTIGRLLKGDED